jgi:hypothetical protein
MALYIPHSILHLARLLYVRPETFGPYYVCTYVRTYVIKPAQAVTMLTSIWQIISLNLGWGTIFFLLYHYLTLNHDGVRIIY